MRIAAFRTWISTTSTPCGSQRKRTALSCTATAVAVARRRSRPRRSRTLLPHCGTRSERQHATCNLQYVRNNKQQATSNRQQATGNRQHASAELDGPQPRRAASRGPQRRFCILPKSHRRLRTGATDPIGVLRQQGVVVCCSEGVGKWACEARSDGFVGSRWQDSRASPTECAGKGQQQPLRRRNSCRWLSHIGALLHATMRVVEALESGTAVLVHCSDGWDRTAQLCSLAQIVVDEHYRTIDGFAVRFRATASPLRQCALGCAGSPAYSAHLLALSGTWELTPRRPIARCANMMGRTAQRR